MAVNRWFAAIILTPLAAVAAHSEPLQLKPLVPPPIPRESETRTLKLRLIEDPVGSFIDVEQLAYYVWVHAEKSAAYRSRTLYVFLAENVPDMLAIRSDRPGEIPAAAAAASLTDVRATIAHWLGVRLPEGSGRPITSLVT